MQEFFTVTEAAEIKNVNPETVRRWLRTGKLQGERLGGTKSGWCIPRAQIYPENCDIDHRLIELMTHIAEDRATFYQFLQLVLQLLKSTALELPISATHTPADVVQIYDLCGQLDSEMADNDTFLEMSYQSCKQQWRVK